MGLGGATISFLDCISVPVFIFQNTEDNAVTTGAEVVSHHTFTLPADPLDNINDVLFFGDARKPFALDHVEKIPAKSTQEPTGPACACDSNMNIGAGESIEQHPGNDFAVALDPHGDEGWMEKRPQFLSQKHRDAIVIFAGAENADHGEMVACGRKVVQGFVGVGGAGVSGYNLSRNHRCLVVSYTLLANGMQGRHTMDGYNHY